MFVLIADIQGSHITVAYGYLPDKKQMSYALFLYLILDAFEAYQEDFRAITGRIHLKLRVIVSDYEVSIHLAFRDFFLMRGCYFHLSQVTLIQYSLGPVSFTKLFRPCGEGFRAQGWWSTMSTVLCSRCSSDNAMDFRSLSQIGWS